MSTRVQTQSLPPPHQQDETFVEHVLSLTNLCSYFVDYVFFGYLDYYVNVSLLTLAILLQAVIHGGLKKLGEIKMFLKLIIFF
jgi:hypothetical protein